MTLAMLRAAVLSVLLGLQPSHLDAGEAPQARAQRLDVVARHITDVAWQRGRSDPGGPWATASVLITLGFHETLFVRYVGEGRCSSPPMQWNGKHASDCDGGAAHTYFQVQQPGCKKLGGKPLGSDIELRIATGCAARIFWAGHKSCGRLLGGFSRYATGSSCNWSGAVERRKTLTDVGKQLRFQLAIRGATAAGAAPSD